MLTPCGRVGVCVRSRVVGYRFGRYLPDAVPLIIKHCNKAGDSDDELKEHCLQARRVSLCVWARGAGEAGDQARLPRGTQLCVWPLRVAVLTRC